MKGRKIKKSAVVSVIAVLAALTGVLFIAAIGGNRPVTIQGTYTVVRDGADVTNDEKFKFTAGDRVVTTSGNTALVMIDDNKSIGLLGDTDIAITAKGTAGNTDVILSVSCGELSVGQTGSEGKMSVEVTLPHFGAAFENGTAEIKAREDIEELVMVTGTATVIANGQTINLNTGDACMYREGEFMYGEKAVIDEYLMAECETNEEQKAKEEAEAFWAMNDSDLSAANVGDKVYFGRYEQDGGETEKIEPIAWDVIAKEDGRLLMATHMCVESMPYNDTDERVTWETCSLRKWLNEEFYYAAFMENEMAFIETAEVTNPGSYDFFGAFYEGTDQAVQGVAGGNTVYDKVFLLSYEEILKYMNPVKLGNGWWKYASSDLIIKGCLTAGIDNTTFLQWDYDTLTKTEPDWPEDSIGLTGCNWWLRDPGDTRDTALNVSYYGYITGGSVVTNDYGVRPAIWVKVE